MSSPRPLTELMAVVVVMVLLPCNKLCAASEVTPQDEFKAATDADRAGKFAEAASHYEKFLTQTAASAIPRPVWIEARTRLATAYFMLHRYRESLETLEPLFPARNTPTEASGTSPRPSSGPSWSGQETPPQAWVVRGLDYLQLNDLPQAIPCFRRALALNPDSGTARLALGDALARSDHMEEAANEYREQLRRTPDLSDAWYKLGLAYSHLADPKVTSESCGRPGRNVLKCQLVAEQLLERGDAWTVARLLLPLVHGGAPPSASQADAHPTGRTSNERRRPAHDQAGLHADLGTALLELGYPHAAEDEFRAELSQDPNSLPALLGRAQTETLQSNWERAVALFDRLHRLYPRELAGRLESLPATPLREALEKGKLTLPTDLSDSPAGRGWSEWLRGAGSNLSQQWNGAREVCSLPFAQIERRPGYWASEACYEKLRKRLTSQGHLSRTEEVKLVEAEYRLGQYESARNRAKALTRSAADEPWAVYWLLKSYAALADHCYEKMSSLNPNSARVHQILARYYADRYEVSRAKTEYEAAIRAAPDLPDSYLGLGELYCLHGEWAEAEVQFKRSLQLSPNSAAANYYLGDVYVQQHQWEQARGYLQRALSDPAFAHRARLDLSKVEAESGEYQAAIKDLVLIAGDDPDGKIHVRLAMLYRKTGDLARAQEAAAKAQDLWRLSLQFDERKLEALERDHKRIQNLDEADLP